MIIPTLSNGILLLLLGGAFIHFMYAGSRTLCFQDAERERAANIAQICFLFSGTMLTWFLGVRMPIAVPNQVASAVVLVSSLSLYEWARHTIWGRRFGLAFGVHVPEALCEDGPYRYIRHPLYLSYGLAFLAELVALPHWATALGFVCNSTLLVWSARNDERVLAGSPLAVDYAAYRQRTGMFIPKFARAASRG